jgi:hypothetical protein
MSNGASSPAGLIIRMSTSQQYRARQPLNPRGAGKTR